MEVVGRSKPEFVDQLASGEIRRTDRFNVESRIHDSMEEIRTDRAPNAIGPYSQGIKDGGRVYVSGQGPVNPETEEVETDDVGDQTARTLENVAEILEAAGTSLDEVVQANVYVTDMDDYDAVNEVYAEYMSDPYPARAAVEVSRLPIDIAVEIEVVASV